MIQFNTIPINTRLPGTMIEFDTSRMANGPVLQNRVLIIGQKLAAGTASTLTVQPVASPGQAVGMFGRGSMLARMVAAFRKVDKVSPLFVVALDDAGGSTAASGTITVTGPATAAGSIALMVAGVAVPVTVPSAASAATIATAIGAAINAKADLPVTASVAAAVVTVTARNKGTAGNAIDVRHSHNKGEALPAGVGLTVVALSGGVGDPDIDTVWPIIGDLDFRTIALGLTDATVLGKVKTELDQRWDAIRQQDTIAYGARGGTQGTLAAFGAALNSQLISVLGTGKSPTWPSEAAAIWAGVCGYNTLIDPARPLQTLSLPGFVAPREEERFIRLEREALLWDGISTFTIGRDGTCYVERAITTYQTDATGADSVAMLDVETVTTMGYLRTSLRVRIASKYPRHKLADNDTNFGQGQAVVTPRILTAELIALAREDWEAKALVENLDQFVAELIVERDANDPNRANALLPPDLVNQLRQFAAQIQPRL